MKDEMAGQGRDLNRTLMIMAGGTGGHIYPGLAVAAHLSARGWTVIWLGAKAGMESALVPPRGYTMAWISISGVRRKGLLRFVMLPLRLVLACLQSARAIFAHRPDVVLGMGGYVSFPGGIMAALLRRPLAIHEQNSVAGLANRVLAWCAQRVLTGFPHVFPPRLKAIHTGNPVREDIAAITVPRERYAARSGPLKLTVIGGSLGAQALNETVPQALALLATEQRPLVRHQTGQQHYASVRETYARVNVTAEVSAFIDDMATCYAQSDLVICRAGASTIAELAAAGVASILVPYPHAVDDHQTGNARFLAQHGASVLIPQHELLPEKLAALISSYTREALCAMAERARELGKPAATQSVAQACMELVPC
jgi:UDP-N-acetylglucosamine--N-acetylmuramyl-(pentapeptide) pyrophosphoryl-undecaprenol N-acetylglucosamine transferase